MSQNNQVKPSLIPAVLALLIVILLGYLLFMELEPSRTEHTVNPPIEIVEPEPLPITIIEPVEPELSTEEITQQEATSFIEALATKEEKAIEIKEQQDQFVRHDSIITLPKIEHRQTSLSELLNDTTLSPDMPISLDYSTSEKVQTSLAQLSDQNDDHMRTITLIDDQGQLYTAPLYQLLEQEDVDLTQAITVIEQQQHQLNLTVAELSKLDTLDPNQELTANITLGTQEIALKDIIQSDAMADNALFYLHRVSKQDDQGLWGIIQTGLIHKFREGVHIDGINKSTVQAVIPEDADEKLESGLSSFLGKILNNKVNTSYVYNFSSNAMSRDPNKIYPGQQLILIHFSDKELSDIYHFFSDKRNQGVDVFAVDL